MNVQLINQQWCLTLNNDIIAVFSSRTAARLFLLWKSKTHEKASS